MAKILLLNGPNLNLLGRREPDLYGNDTLDGIEQRLHTLAGQAGHVLHALQSNAEHELIDAIQAAPDDGTAIVLINPGGLTHTSVALRDAFLATTLPFIEVHLSNIAAREPFRHRSLLSDIAVGTICGFGAIGYELAMHAAIDRLTEQ